MLLNLNILESFLKQRKLKLQKKIRILNLFCKLII